jgi:hypothetical protein
MATAICMDKTFKDCTSDLITVIGLVISTHLIKKILENKQAMLLLMLRHLTFRY